HVCSDFNTSYHGRPTPELTNDPHPPHRNERYSRTVFPKPRAMRTKSRPDHRLAIIHWTFDSLDLSSVDSPFTSTTDAEEAIDSCLDIILRHASRWLNASLRLLFPYLRKKLHASPNTVTEILAFASAPQLKGVEMLLGPSVYVDAIALPYAQLTSITGPAVTSKEFFTMLSRSPNLVHGVFVLCGSEVLIDHALPLSRLSLKSLTLWAGSTTAPHLITALDSLVLPGLETLELSHYYDRSLPPYDEQHFLDCLTQTPMLSTLRVHHHSPKSCTTLVRGLGVYLDLVPALRTLLVSSRTDFPLDTLLDMLVSRSNPERHVRLQHFELLVPSANDRTLDRLQFDEFVRANRGSRAFILAN
ncbi:hypothetical protein DFH07DRAFT_1020330, partial [Mycena maculata]